MDVTNTEIWKDVAGYEGFYEVSNLGRLRTLRRWSHGKICKLKQPKVLRLFLNKTTGYICYVMGRWGIYPDRQFRIHRLVAAAFIPNPDNLPEVNHIDGNKLNNHATNLEWNTRLQNIQHAYKNNLIPILKGAECWNTKLNETVVREIFHSSIGPRKLSRLHNLPYSTVNGIKNGSNWNHITGLPKKKWRKHDSGAISN